MTPLQLSRIAALTGGRLLGDDLRINALVTDTRTLVQGEAPSSALFVALQGERFDGHAHVHEAVAAGVPAALVSREIAIDGLSQVVVANTEQALAALAAGLQRQRRTRVIAITGSNGKTSVKALVGAILQQAAPGSGDSIHSTPGNRNNEIGLPLAVIDAPDDAAFAVYEMGTGKPGDIAYLTRIAPPDIALVNNVAPAHLERMGSLLAIADTKAAVYDALPAGGVAVINADDAFAPYFAERAHGRRILRFALEHSADVRADDVQLQAQASNFRLSTPEGGAQVRLPLSGRHNIANALAAAAVALGAGVALDDIVRGLQAVRPVAGRLHALKLRNGAVLIDDSYNANPGSMHAAIETLSADGGEAWLVLGDMRELGPDAAVLHAEAGRRARAAGIARLYALGPLSAQAAQAFGADAMVFESHAALADALRADLAAAAGVRCLVKGSRGSAMDRVVSAVLADPGLADLGLADRDRAAEAAHAA